MPGALWEEQLCTLFPSQAAEGKRGCGMHTLHGGGGMSDPTGNLPAESRGHVGMALLGSLAPGRTQNSFKLLIG